MTTLLEKAFSEASKLSEQEQNSIAEVVLAELASDKRWHQLFNESQGLLADLASEALAEHKAGKTQTLDCND